MILPWRKRDFTLGNWIYVQNNAHLKYNLVSTAIFLLTVPFSMAGLLQDYDMIRYFVRTILQFQFLEELCSVAGHTGPLHRYTLSQPYYSSSSWRNSALWPVIRVHYSTQVYFVHNILQLQFLKELCSVAGHTGPLHRYTLSGPSYSSSF